MKLLICILIGTFSFSVLSQMTGSIGVTSNYIWRGITQTNNNSAVQGALDMSFSHTNTGVWISNTVDGSEADFYFAGHFKLSQNIILNSSVTYYHYLPSTKNNTVELLLGLNIWGIDINTNYTPDYFNTDSSAFYFYMTKSFSVSQKEQLSINISIGYSLFDDEQKVGMENYIDYKLELQKHFNNLDLLLSFSDTDLKNREDQNFSISSSYAF